MWVQRNCRISWSEDKKRNTKTVRVVPNCKDRIELSQLLCWPEPSGRRAAALYVLFIISSFLPISSLGLPWRRLELMRSPTCLMVTGGSQGITAGGGINWDSKLLLGFFTPSRGKGSVGGGGINCWDSRGLLYPWLRGKGGGIRMLGLILSVSRPPGLGLGNSTSSDLTADRSFQPTFQTRKGPKLPSKRKV